jgi:plastocyanin
MKRYLMVAGALLLPAAALANGSVTGLVKLKGRSPALPALQVTKDASVCGADKPNEAVVVTKGGALANVVVSLRAPKPAAAPPPTANAAIDQHGCRYQPHVQAVTVGTPLALVNSDAVLHNVHGSSGPVQVFNMAMPIKNQRVPTKLTRPGLVRLQCDAGHTWMNAWISVFEHPFFAVTTADGTFEIKNVPPGHYAVDYWHEPLDGKGAGVTTAAEVDVKDGAPSRADAVLAL